MLRWLLPALVPSLLLLGVVYVSDRRREPWYVVLGTFVLGGVTGYGAIYLQQRAQAWTGLDLRSEVAGNAGALLFIFAFIAPVRELAKVIAVWPAFRSRFFDEPLDGVVYAASASLGASCVQSAHMFQNHELGLVWVLRAVLSLVANVFFACAWGYALGRVKQKKSVGSLLAFTWTASTMAHGLYIHLVLGRGSAAMVGVAPLLLAMALLTYFGYRDLKARGDAREDRPSGLLERVSMHYLSAPPSLRSVQEAMRKQGQPLTLRWVGFGTLVTLGTMFSGLALAVAFGHYADVDFSRVDESDVTTTGPVALLGSGLLAAFPLSGYLIAKASSLHTLLEPALATALALVLTMVALGAAAPVALAFALAFSPIALGLAVAGAWVGRP